MCTSLQLKFAAFTHLAEGQFLCVTKNVTESPTLGTETRSPVWSKMDRPSFKLA
jgi:hypothetical protein